MVGILGDAIALRHAVPKLMSNDQRGCKGRTAALGLFVALAHLTGRSVDQCDADVGVEQVVHLKYSRMGARFCFRPSGKSASPLIESIRANNCSGVSFLVS